MVNKILEEMLASSIVRVLEIVTIQPSPAPGSLPSPLLNTSKRPKAPSREARSFQICVFRTSELQVPSHTRPRLLDRSQPASARVEAARRMSSLLPFLLQVTVLFLIHLAFGFSRLIALGRSVPSLVMNLSLRTTQATSPSLPEDLARWKKIPAHIAVIWSPGSNTFTWQSNKGDVEIVELEKLISDAKLLIGWCEEMGVASLSMYDSEGESFCRKCSQSGSY